MVHLIAIFLVALFCARVLSDKCGTLLDNEVSPADKKIIMDKHNDVRQQILDGKVSGQPKAKTMPMLKWDEKLAAEGKKIAATCEFKHVKVNDSRFAAVGQNLFWDSSKTKASKWENSIQGWFDEHKKYKYEKFSRATMAITGHYTQLIWANTLFVGCGYALYQPKPEGFFERLYVCNYGPPANYEGEYPYESDGIVKSAATFTVHKGVEKVGISEALTVIELIQLQMSAATLFGLIFARFKRNK